MSAIRQRFEPAVRRLLHLYWRFARGLTLGVRAVVLDAQGRVFLIKHTYVAGWHLPGGGVEAGETLLEALHRELLEEGNIIIEAAPTLHGVFFNSHVSLRDHVAVYVVTAFHQPATPPPNREIAASGFFPLDDLPDDITTGTRRRLAEVTGKTPVINTWR